LFSVFFAAQSRSFQASPKELEFIMLQDPAVMFRKSMKQKDFSLLSALLGRDFGAIFGGGSRLALGPVLRVDESFGFCLPGTSFLSKTAFWVETHY
jgi:hypothetical protein